MAVRRVLGFYLRGRIPPTHRALWTPICRPETRRFAEYPASFFFSVSPQAADSLNNSGASDGSVSVVR